MKIYTIGHSTRELKSFIKILLDNRIKCVVDVRSYPFSRVSPQFNGDSLKKSLVKYGIKYYHVTKLGGRRRATTNMHKSIRSPGFAGYADYMMTNDFKIGIRILKRIARKCKTVYMCSEALWWRCHRRMISDRLFYDGWQVYHLGVKKDPIPHIKWNIARLNKHNEIIYDRNKK